MRPETTELVLKYLPWPVVTLVVALVAMPFFRRQISKFSERITGVFGVKAEVPASQPLPKEIADEMQESPTKDSPGAAIVTPSFQMPVRKEVEDELAKMKLSVTDERDHLIQAVVQARFIIHHQRAARFVFGSQLQLLTTTNGAGGPITLDAVRRIYEAAASQYPSLYQNFSFDRWLSFLTGNRFVEVHEDKIVTTDIGRAFMNFLVFNHDTGPRTG